MLPKRNPRELVSEQASKNVQKEIAEYLWTTEQSNIDDLNLWHSFL